MTVVVVSCTLCGTTNHVPVGAIFATVNLEGLEAHLAGAVTWVCDGCAQIVSETVSWHPFLLLLTAGVPLLDDDPGDDRTDEPAPENGSEGRPGAPGAAVTSEPTRTQPPHPEQRRDGPALTRDDLLTLHELLSSDTWFDQVSSYTHR